MPYLMDSRLSVFIDLSIRYINPGNVDRDKIEF